MKNMTVSKALMWMFISQVLALLGIIPILGGILVIVGFVLELMALYGASKLDEGYKSAFTLSIVGIVLAVVSLFTGDGLIGTIVSVVEVIVSLAVLYYVVMTTVARLESIGENGVAAKGKGVWKLNMIFTVSTVVLAILAVIVPLLAAVLMIIAAIIGIVAGILYMVFLYKSSKALA